MEMSLPEPRTSTAGGHFAGMGKVSTGVGQNDASLGRAWNIEFTYHASTEHHTVDRGGTDGEP